MRPIPEACPQCGNPYLLFRERKSGNVFACDKAGCGFEKPAGVLPELREVVIERPASRAEAGEEEGAEGAEALKRTEGGEGPEGARKKRAARADKRAKAAAE